MNVFCELLFFAFLFKLIFTKFEGDPDCGDNCEEDDDDIVYPRQSNIKENKQEKESWRRQDLKSNIRTYYTNYTELDFKVSDFEILFRKGILTENQAILMWESLLNSKTERNLEWLEYNKLIKSSSNPSSNTQENKYFQNLALLFNTKEYKYYSFFAYFGGVIIYMFAKSLFSFPKLNLVILTIVIILNILNSFYFYNRKCFFTSCVCLCSFLSNLYFIYISLAMLCGEKEVDCSIFYVKHFKKKEHFILKVGICSFILVTLIYLTSFSLRFHLNYVISFFLYEKIREMIKNYFRLNSLKEMQPINSFVSLIFGLVIFIYTNAYYYANISFSYELNSFLFVNNFITFYYFCSLDRYVYIQRNDLGESFLDAEKTNERRDKYEVFEELKQKKKNLERLHRRDNILDVNLIDIVILLFALLFLILGYIFTTYFYIVLSFFFLHTLHRNSLIFLNKKTARIVSSFLLVTYLLIISNLSKISFSYVNEIIALYDQKFLDILLLLVKLSFFLLSGICIYMNEDYGDLFSFYNYSSYKYLSREFSIQNNPRISRVLSQVYSTRCVIFDILLGDLSFSIERMKMALEAINDGNNNINELYIETLMKRAASNVYIIIMLIDYTLISLSLFIVNDIFNNNTNSFFYITYLMHRIGIYLKLSVLFLEYSKTLFLEYSCLILNCVLMLRIYNYPDSDYIDYFFAVSIFTISFFVYILFMESSHVMNLFFVSLFWIFFNVNIKGVLALPVLYGMLFSKFIGHFFKIQPFVIGIIIIFLFGFLFSLLNFEQIKWFNYELTYSLIKLFQFDVMEYLSRLCFITLRRSEYFEITIIDYFKTILESMHNFIET